MNTVTVMLIIVTVIVLITLFKVVSNDSCIWFLRRSHATLSYDEVEYHASKALVYDHSSSKEQTRSVQDQDYQKEEEVLISLDCKRIMFTSLIFNLDVRLAENLALVDLQTIEVQKKRLFTTLGSPLLN